MAQDGSDHDVSEHIARFQVTGGSSADSDTFLVLSSTGASHGHIWSCEESYAEHVWPRVQTLDMGHIP